MRWPLIIASLIVAVITGTFAIFVVLKDREEAIDRAAERTASISRMIIAHGDSSADIADQIMSVAMPLVTAWDLKELTQVAELSTRLRQLVGNNNVVASAAVVDARGTVLVTSRGFPPPPLNVADRPFHIAHAAGTRDPLIAGDVVAGPITGRKRFTFSRANRNADGSLRAVVVAAIYTSSMDVLYAEAANWPGARAGLYGPNGDVLAQAQTASRASPAFLAEVERIALTSENLSGTAFSTSEPEPRIVSWSRSRTYPGIYAASSQTLTEALKAWQSRAWLTGILVSVANIMFWGFAFYAARSTEARHAAESHELAVREVHHRLKNSLQLISSLIRMRSAKFTDPQLREVVSEITNDLKAVAEVHSLVQGASKPGTVDIAQTIKTLCEYLHSTYRAEMTCNSTSSVIINANHATALSVIVNELVTNAIKHGGGRVEVSCHNAADTFHIQIMNDGTQLPDDFDVETTDGFGLRAVRAMLSGYGGKIHARSRDDGGAVFTVSLPMGILLQK
jgi:two-component sensor histidine kinase